MSDALGTWKERLEYFQSQEASTADPDQKFALHKKIKEAEAKIAALEAAAVPQSSAVLSAFQAARASHPSIRRQDRTVSRRSSGIAP